MTRDTNAEPLVVSMRAIGKRYAAGSGDVVALRDVSLSIARGEFVAIVGSSGSGKSTLLNLLGCLDEATDGTYELAGVNVGSVSNERRARMRNALVGFVFQGFHLLPRTTALENCEVPMGYRGVGRKERTARATEALRRVGLGARLHHTPNQLSGGQQQRVAIARAIVTDPPLLLADEPTGNLDTRASLEVMALLQRLNREQGLTVVVVTHEPAIAATAGRVLTVRDGRIVADVRQAPVDARNELALLPPAPVAVPQVAPHGAESRRAIRSGTRGRRLGRDAATLLVLASSGVMLATRWTGTPLGGRIHPSVVSAAVVWALALACAAVGGLLRAVRTSRKRASRT